jgi:hypothetical protein
MSILGQIIGGVLDYRGARSQNRFNERMMDKSHAFTERMSNTAYTRAARDLENAGLNRILALGSPATTPGSNMATGVNELQGPANSARNIAFQNAQIKLLKEQAKKTSAETQLTKNKSTITGGGAQLMDDATNIYNTAKDAMQNKSLINDLSGMFTNSAKDIRKGIDEIKDAISAPFRKANQDHVQHQINKLKKMKFSDTSKRWYRLSNGKWYDLKNHKVVDIRTK